MNEFANKNDEKRPTKDFRLDEVLTVASGINFLDIADDPDPNAFTRRVGDLLSFMTDEGQLETHQLPRVADEVRAAILQEHPEIAGLLAGKPEGPPLDASDEQERAYETATKAWYGQVKAKLGEEGLSDPVTLSPVPPEDHTPVDALTEYGMMGGNVLRTTDEFLDFLGDRALHGPGIGGTSTTASPMSYEAGKSFGPGSGPNSPSAPPPASGPPAAAV